MSCFISVTLTQWVLNTTWFHTVSKWPQNTDEFSWKGLLENVNTGRIIDGLMLFIKHLFVCLCVLCSHVWLPPCAYEGQKTHCLGWFSASSIWLPGIELRSSALTSSSFIGRAISPVYTWYFSDILNNMICKMVMNVFNGL